MKMPPGEEKKNFVSYSNTSPSIVLILNWIYDNQTIFPSLLLPSRLSLSCHMGFLARLFLKELTSAGRNPVGTFSPLPSPFLQFAMYMRGLEPQQPSCTKWALKRVKCVRTQEWNNRCRVPTTLRPHGSLWMAQI